MVGGIHGGADLIDRQEHAGGGFILHHAHRFDGVRGIGGQGRLQGGDFNAVLPVAGQFLHGDAHIAHHAGPAFREHPGFRHQHGIAGGQHVDDGGFPGGVAGAGIHEHVLGGFHDTQNAVPAFLVQLHEFRGVEVHRVMADRVQNAFGNVGRAGIGEKQAAARLFRLGGRGVWHFRISLWFGISSNAGGGRLATAPAALAGRFDGAGGGCAGWAPTSS